MWDNLHRFLTFKMLIPMDEFPLVAKVAVTTHLYICFERTSSCFIKIFNSQRTGTVETAMGESAGVEFGVKFHLLPIRWQWVVIKHWRALFNPAAVGYFSSALRHAARRDKG